MLPFSAIITPAVTLGAYLFLAEALTMQKAFAIAAISASVFWFALVQ